MDEATKGDKETSNCVPRRGVNFQQLKNFKHIENSTVLSTTLLR